MRRIIVALALILSGCSSPETHQKQSAGACKYTCTMDKDVCASKPGVCPKCGMELVEKSDK